LEQQLSKLLAERSTRVVLGTLSPDGLPHVTADVEIVASEGGNLLYREYLESSASAHHLTHSLWYDRAVVLSVVGAEQHLHVRAIPTRAHVTGPLYQREYVEAEARGTDELASVWELRVLDIRDETPAALRAEERKHRPFFTHLDRLVKSV
jgi:hypothetical protein